jgi:predicted SAM-dependent methyltransferase
MGVKGAKEALRGLLRMAGVEVYRSRGGLFICPVPHASIARNGAIRDAKRLHLGCGNIRLDGYVNIDVVATPATDIVANIVSLPMIADSSVEEVRLEAVLEHLYRFEKMAALREWCRVLRPGGLLKIMWIPDFSVYADRFLNKRPGSLADPMSEDEVRGYTHGNPMPGNAPEQVHKDIFTKESVRASLEEAGFEVVEIKNACFEDEPVPLNINVVAKKR